MGERRCKTPGPHPSLTRRSPSLTLAHPRSITPNRLLPPCAIPDTACAFRFKLSCQWIWGTGYLRAYLLLLILPSHLRPNRLKLFPAPSPSFSLPLFLASPSSATSHSVARQLHW